ncbi:MAG: hypothetical protein GY786_04190 [Proteobacteria bacterium]|nr:hypothetical protein [Pseudomonadota bacterium]
MKKPAFRTMRQEHYFPVIIGIHFIFWIIDLSIYTGDYEFTPKHVVGEIFSSWVVTVFAFNFLMTTRARWVERIFGGLDKMYLIHRRSGIIAIVLLVLHFVVIPMDPRFTIGKPLGFFAFVLIFLGVIFSALPIFKRLFRYNRWRLGHKILGLAYLAGIAHSFTVPTLTSELPIVKTYVYGMALIGVTAWLYKAFFYRIFNRRLPYTVESLKPLENDIIEVNLKPEGDKLQHLPGQFAFLSFDGIGTSEAHPYTISSRADSETLRFTIKALGDYTSKLGSTLKVGCRALVEGAFGHFYYKNGHFKNQIWIAGGIGVTPFLSALDQVDLEYSVDFTWVVRSNEVSNHAAEIEKQKEEQQNVTTTIHNSDKEGLFHIGSKYISKDLEDRSIFICGPVMMRESLISQLLEKGVSIKNIHWEEFAFR